MKETKFPAIYRQGRNLYTVNLTPGKTVYSERLVKYNNTEYREWDPHKSKLAAAIKKDLNQMGLEKSHNVLYLGASTGTTVSHVSDIVGKEGFVFAVELAPRVTRNLVFLAQERKNIAPILADASKPETYFHRIQPADFLYQDIAQKNQAEIFLKNMEFLKQSCFGILCVKSRSIDITKKPSVVFAQVRKKLDKELKVVDKRHLSPFQKDHCMFVCKKD